MAIKRRRHQMPESIREALTADKLMDAYLERPAYQQNDYIGWIIRAVREETQHRRLKQMLEELRGGEKYMGMKWNNPRQKEKDR